MSHHRLCIAILPLITGRHRQLRLPIKLKFVLYCFQSSHVVIRLVKFDFIPSVKFALDLGVMSDLDQ